MKRILKDPLVHFLALGAALFVLFELVASDEASYDSKVINVDRDSLLTFLQYRTRAFESRSAGDWLDDLGADELDRLIDDYVREEALHREAIALGVDKNDYVIKQRMIQSIQFITDGFVAAAVEVTDEDVAEYYDVNREDYFVSPFVTFTHVFVDGDRHGRDGANALANAKLEELNKDVVQFSDAPRHGDRFPYFLNYVERDPQFVASHFGPEMAQQIFALEPDDATWHGPFESEFGLHLVMLVKKEESRYPELSEIEDAVREDAQREKIAARKDEAIQAIVDTYEIRRTYEQPQSSASQQ